MRQHKVFLRHELLKYNSEKSTAKSSALENYISSANLSLSGCSSAEPNSVSVGRCKFQLKKLYLQTVKKVDHLPHYIFFDEATSALDAENEKIIHNNLQDFFSGKTVVIIAHRLSTVKNADNIIVLKKGKIVEQGSHHELVTKKAEYFNLVKNQLELGT